MDNNIIIKKYNGLTLNELYEMLHLRAEVFVVEQNCAYQDLDGVDKEATHVFTLGENGECTSCARMYRDASENGVLRIGRLIAKERGKGHGMRLLLACIGECRRQGADEVRLHAQQYAIGFYEKAGFAVCSELFFEVGIPHVEMRLLL